VLVLLRLVVVQPILGHLEAIGEPHAIVLLLDSASDVLAMERDGAGAGASYYITPNGDGSWVPSWDEGMYASPMDARAAFLHNKQSEWDAKRKHSRRKLEDPLKAA
jgi:hypothetical protein